jgi:hypothetical protein
VVDAAVEWRVAGRSLEEGVLGARVRAVAAHWRLRRVTDLLIGDQPTTSTRKGKHD